MQAERPSKRFHKSHTSLLLHQDQDETTSGCGGWGRPLIAYIRIHWPRVPAGRLRCKQCYVRSASRDCFPPSSRAGLALETMPSYIVAGGPSGQCTDNSMPQHVSQGPIRSDQSTLSRGPAPCPRRHGFASRTRSFPRQSGFEKRLYLQLGSWQSMWPKLTALLLCSC